MPRKGEAQLGPADDRGGVVNTQKFTTDSRGNTVLVADLERRKAEQAEREAAARRRAARAATLEAQGGKLDIAAKGAREKAKCAAALAAAREKHANGSKLSGKERKLIKKWGLVDRDDSVGAADEATPQPPDDGLDAFSLHVQGSGTGSPDECDAGVSSGKGTSGSASNPGRDVVVTGFDISAPGRELYVSATLRLQSGHRYGLLGANGCGKTTLLRFLAARRLPLPAQMEPFLVQQEVPVSPQPLWEQVVAADQATCRLAREEEQLLQELEEIDDENQSSRTDEWWSAKIGRLTHVAEELESRAGQESQARKILSGLGFSSAMIEEGSEKLSGGWRMRVSLAQALLIQPELLLLDEPTNHLDLDATIWLEEHLRTEFRGIVLLVSHDAGFIDATTDSILYLEDAQLFKYTGSVDAFLR